MTPTMSPTVTTTPVSGTRTTATPASERADVPVPGSPRPVTPTTILADTLERLSRQLDAVDGVSESARAELREACRLAGGLDPYLSRWTTPESPALRRLADRTSAADWGRHRDGRSGRLAQQMLSGHVAGQTLKMLVHATGARRVLDVGMSTGYAALAMAEALPPDGWVVGCEIDPEVAAFAQRCLVESAAGLRVDVRVGPARLTLRELAAAGETFDLVLIDADEAGYVDYLRSVLDAGLLSPGGLVCVGNTLMQGQPWLPGPTTDNGCAIEEFNRSVAADPRVEQVVLPLRDGLTLIRRVDEGHRAP
jgi:caffeoyl-CoA O-methyltransferase